MEQSNDYLQDVDTILNIDGIGEDIWRKCQAYVEALKDFLKKKDILNKNQCKNLYKNIECIMEVYDYLMIFNKEGFYYELLLRELFVTLNKAYSLLKNCGK